MFGTTITLNLGTVADPVEITLTRINDGNYSSEYRLKESDREHILLVRHSKEKNKLKGATIDRHNVTYTQNFFPTELYPLGQTVQASAVIRGAVEQPSEDVISVANAISALVADGASNLVNWEN